MLRQYLELVGIGKRRIGQGTDMRPEQNQDWQRKRQMVNKLVIS